MSSALVRQALELVDQEDSGEAKRGGRRARPRHAGQDHRQLYKSKKPQAPAKSKEQQAEENVSKLLKLSTRTAHPSVADKIVERAVKRKALADTPQERRDDYKSILFPDTEPQDIQNELGS
uniref:Active regulator of SIRT1 n=1 Tax=Heliothis virescens TaxID=7102 RepID=A0A2A4K106_HELVI